MTAYTYSAEGDVRGSCGHQHQTPEAAEECAGRDGRACRALPGGHRYSDREVRRSDGEPMVEDDRWGWGTVDELAELDEADEVRS